MSSMSFTEFVEAVARVALTKWPNDRIPASHKISFALEAVTNLARQRDTQDILETANKNEMEDDAQQAKSQHQDVFKKMVSVRLAQVCQLYISYFVCCTGCELLCGQKNARQAKGCEVEEKRGLERISKSKS